MSQEAPTPPLIQPRTPPEPRGRQPRSRWLWLLLSLLAVVPASLWASGVRPDHLWNGEEIVYETVAVDRGDIFSTVVESGSLESTNSVPVRCQVEALVGPVGGGSGLGGSSGRSAAASIKSSSAGSSAGAAARTAVSSPKSSAATKASSGASSASAGGIIQKPTIQSFSFSVSSHTPLRPASAINTRAQQLLSGSGNERVGSTQILKILDEGTYVEKGQIVCWLDSSAFEDELRAQKIRYAQAKSWVEQAQRALQVAQIEYDQYKNGIYAQDLQLIDQYIDTCKLRMEQTQQTLDWEHSMVARSLRTPTQARAAEYAHERAVLALREAEGMKTQLVKYSGPKNLTNIEAKIASVEADLQAQNASYELEKRRKERLEEAIENCILRAPSEGILVYYNQTNNWGRVETQIHEGLTVHENQPIFMVPDMTTLRVKTRINETKVALLEPGTRALVQADAFPNQSFRGRITEVTVIPSPVNGPFSDVQVYFAMVELDSGSELLQTGMTARVEFLIDHREDVTRVPVRAVRWFEGEPFVALPQREGRPIWRHVELGLRNSGFAEVRRGLEPGELVIAEPGPLDPPSRAEREAARASESSLSMNLPKP